MKQILAVMIGALAITGCDSITGSGRIITEKREMGTFEGINISGSIDVEVLPGADYKVEVEADDNVMQYIITDIRKGRLDVRYRSNMSFMNVHAKVFVTAPGFDQLSVSGSGNITSRSPIVQDQKIAVKVSGSGDINIELEAPEVEAGITGSGAITISGRTRNFDASITGSGDIKCGELKSESTSIEITGSGTAHVFASVFLKARTRGSGDIVYIGHPGTTDIKKGGSGSIEGE